MNVRQALTILYILAFVVIGVCTTVFFVHTREEYLRLVGQETASRKKLAELEAKLHDQEKVLSKLRNDPVYLEKVIRQKLGFAKPGEMIFRFDDK